MKSLGVFTILSVALLRASAVVQAADWDFQPKVYIGWLAPGGDAETGSGIVLGGQGNVSVEGTVIRDGISGKDRVAVLVFAGIKGEGLSNGENDSDIKFSEFDLNAGLAVGPNESSWKWRTPVNIALSRDIVTNQAFGVRYAFSGLQIRFINEEGTEEQVKQVLDFVSDVVVEHFSYNKGWQAQYEPVCTPDRVTCEYPQPTNPKASDRTIFGLYSRVNYEIAKRGLGLVAAAELTQAISRNYTKADLTVTGYKQFKGDLNALRLFAELRGTVDYDTVDPVSKVQGAARGTLGFSSEF